MAGEVIASDGVRLRVHESGRLDAPTVVCVHGYPDDHTIWDGVVAELSQRLHVVSYDVRGAGESGKPRKRRAYRIDQLAEDLAAVVEAVSPQRPVHLLAHDWGSVQTWHAVTGQWLRGRVASYTSISGPCLDHAGHWFRARLRRPTPRSLGELIVQAMMSSYIAFFQLPLLPELAWRSRIPQLAISLIDPTSGSPTISDAVRGLQLYRANMVSRLGRPGSRRTDLPVQILVPQRDPFVRPSLQSDIARWVPHLRVHTLPGGHWLPRAQPRAVARCTSELIHETASEGESHGP